MKILLTRIPILLWGLYTYFLIFTFTFIHLADTFIQSDLQLRNTISNTL